MLTLAISLTDAFAYFDFEPLLLVMTQHQLIGQPAKDWSQPVFKDQFPFPLAPEFWGSWNDSWLKTNLFVWCL
jgi:hypothetical protein